MSKFNLIIIGLAILLVLGALAFRYNNALTGVDENKLLMDTQNYVDYSDANFEFAKEKGRPVLFFAATIWCQTCAQLEKEILERISELPEDVVILKIDFDRDSKMKSEWSVTSQHTLIILDNNGEEITRWIGGGLNTLLDQLEKR